MIVMKKDEAARIAVKKMEEAGANDIKKNEPFVAIRAHLEAMDMFSKWSRLFNSSAPADIQEITSGLTFVQVNRLRTVGDIPLIQFIRECLSKRETSRTKTRWS